MDLAHSSVSADILCEKAIALIEAGRPGAARPLLTAARAIAGRTDASLRLAIRIAAAEGDWPAALRELDDALGDNPDDPDLHKYRAEARHRSGDIEGAARDAADAVCLDPSDARAKALLGAALLDLGLTPQATACLREAVAGSPTDPLYREGLAAALERDGAADQALTVLTDGIAAAPDNVAIRNAAILLCLRRRDFLRAARLAEAARQAGMIDAATLGMMGHALASLGRHDDAALAYQDALKLDPTDEHLRHLATTAGLPPDPGQAPDARIRAMFDHYADRFEAHLIGLGYGIPTAIRRVVETHPAIAAGQELGPVLDLGCGTGLVALTLGDLPLGPFTGIDISPRMLDQARVKRLYADLREAEVVAALNADTHLWPLIVAADVVCYFGALEPLLSAVHARLAQGGWFIFSTEELLPDHDGIIPGNGDYALGRQGRYAHAAHYVYEAACAAGFRVRRFDRPVIRQEAGGDVAGLMLTLERVEPS